MKPFGLGFSKIRLKRLAESLSDMFDVKITSGPFWATDCKEEIVIKEDDLGKYSDQYILALTIHESAHIYFKSKHNPSMPKDYKSAYSLLNNAVEDIRIERLMQEEYIGSRKFFKSFYDYMKPRLKEMLEAGKMPPYLEFLANIGTHAHEYTDKYIGKSKKAEEAYKEAYPIMEKAWNSNSSDEALKYIDQVWEKYKRLVPPTDQQIKKETDKMVKEIIKMIARHSTLTPDEMKKKIEQAKARGSKFGTVSEPGQKPQKKEDGPSFGSAPGRESVPHEEADVDYWEYYSTVRPFISFFSQRFNQALIDNKFDRLGGTYRRGTLNARKLYKTKLGFSRVFMQKVSVEKKEYQISLLIDVSGSMDDVGGRTPNYEYCRYTAVLCGEMLQRIGLPFQIITFDDEPTVLKKFSEPFADTVRRTLVRNIGAYGGTVNSRALKEAVKNEYKGLKHIIINVTDGDVDSETYDLSKKYIESGRLVVGVGIGDNMERINESFPLHVSVKDIPDIPRGIADFLGKYLRRRFA